MSLARKRTTETVRITIPAEIRKSFDPSAAPAIRETVNTQGDTTSIGLSVKSRQTGAYQELFKSIYDGLVITNTDGLILEVNSRASLLLKYSHEEFSGKRVTDFIDGATESLIPELLNSTKNEAFTLIEAYCIRKDGTDFPAEVVVHTINLGQGPQLCFFMRDISKRIQMEKDLIRLSKAVESTGDAIAITDDQFTHIYHNRACQNLLGHMDVPVQMTGFEGFFENPETAREIQDTLASGETWSGEVSLHTQDGRTVPTLFRADAIRLDDESLFGAVAIMSDITTQKRAEEELKDALAELARSNADLEQLAYVASHDLKEPLRVIAGYLQLIDRRYRDRLDDTASEYMQHVIDGAERMKNMINCVLEYSRLTRPTGPLDTVNTGDIVAQALANLKSMITERNARIHYEKLPSIQAVPTRMVQVFQNLIGNAIKFCERDVPEIHIWAEEKAGEDVFYLKDNGVGINPAVSDRAFMLFQRLHTQKEYSGSGIGLATCKKIVEQLGGKIWIAASTEGEGTTFAFSVPHQDET